MKINNVYVLLVILLISCNKNTENVDELQILRESTNSKSYPVIQMDSLQAVHSITKQKVQELIDLSALYLAGNQETPIDKAIFKQMEEYFYKTDSLTFRNLFDDFKNFQVKYGKVKKLEVYKEIRNTDTLNLATFSVEYVDKNNKNIGEFERNAQYIMTPNKANKEFKFYFLQFYHDKKDSISVGVTR